MGDYLETETGRDTNYAKNGSVVINLHADLSGLREELKNKNIEQKYLDRLTSAQEKLFNIQSVMFVLQEENNRLRNEIKSLKEAIDLKGKMEYEKPFYYSVDGKEKDGPFCPRCWDDETKQIRLLDYGKDNWQCPKCEIPLAGPNYHHRDF